MNAFHIPMKRFFDDGDTTIGALRVNNIRVFTVEDEHRHKKVYGETRIPQGSYEIKLRTEGGMHARYLEKYGESFHKGMLWLQDVPEFEYVYIHPGNTDEDSLGCILVNESVTGPTMSGAGSVAAYRKIYPVIAELILSGVRVFIDIMDCEI
jgi:hypothetical protein